MKIAVKTKDPYLYQKILLILNKTVEVFRYSSSGEPFDLLLTDGDGQAAAGVINMGRYEGADLKIPFTESELKDAVFNRNERSAQLALGDRCAFLRGRKIPLTELEFSLLSALYEARGEFVSREELHGKVFGENNTPGLLNVYIHYLREKIEGEDEKIILSSRKQGYKINERYI